MENFQTLLVVMGFIGLLSSGMAGILKAIADRDTDAKTYLLIAIVWGIVVLIAR